ncbi:MAG: ABC transporter [Chloroflexi bacterium RBG_16_48_8]|nr:MAG: ABC transporter [Chloroflexi bacterium RBG_16_48_8]
MPDFAIQTEKLTRDFGEVRAVDGLTMEVPRGAVFGFLGPNGAGKTTTIRLLLGLLEPSEGRAEVLGFDVRKEADRIRTSSGALLEHSGLYERLSAEDNLEFYGRIWHLADHALKIRTEELLKHLGLWERRKETVGTWSRGMRQKLAVARTLLHQPELIFTDEPTAGLDPIAASSLREDLASLAQQEGVTIFLTTHNLDEAEKLCDLVCVIREGKIVAIGRPVDLQRNSFAPSVVINGCGFSEKILTALRERPDVVSVENEKDRLVISLRGSGEVAPIINLIVMEGAEVEEVKKGKASLEEVFLLLMQEEGE